MPDYSLGKIYMIYPKVEDADEGDVYYGSTTNTLARRMSEHRRKECSSKILFDKYGVENCFIELVENYPCETKDELNKKEGEYIRNYKCVNKAIPGRTRKEYYIDNSDKVKEYKKQYYIENIDNIKEEKKQKTNCPQCNKEMNKRCISRHIKSGYCRNLHPSVHTTAPELD
tara:strand:- start:224 stop:736 length:513 start_codon:yes stop_codon:yes gene_type:complete